jgi:proline iminopeptidase
MEQHRMSVSVRGAEIFHLTRGRGPTCLVLTSIGTRPYERQMPAQLDERLRLAFVDLRGSGRSTGEASELTFDILAEDLEAVRAELGVPHLAVLGHSVLGILALEYGRRCPDSVSHVIAVGTPPHGDMNRLAAQSAAFFEEDASAERKQLLRDNLAALPPGASRSETVFAHSPMRFFDPRFDPAPLFAEAEVRPQFLAHVFGTLVPTWDVTVDPGSLRVPVLIAHGRYDYVVPHTLWAGPTPALPDASLQIFERSGHQPFLEEPQRFTDAITLWMSRRPRPR